MTPRDSVICVSAPKATRSDLLKYLNKEAIRFR